MTSTPTSTPRRFRYSIGTLLLLTLCVAGLLGGYVSGWRWGHARGVKQYEAERIYTVTYQVSDILRPDIHTAPNSLDYDGLIEAITTEIEPTSWDEVGGPGSIAPLEANVNLVVSQTKEVHHRIVELLSRRRDAMAKESLAPKSLTSATEGVN